ncbi:hypothetical protein [Pseudoalteromonas sp. SK18]|uniref:hypothetical protein n=1 Tax=Pseudoalteromonas sp. SK18 TaxID=1938366 RepID=UPI00111575A6|nr:hypothetical protein [Pseudoalteromonas sp. SK18]
MHHRVHRGAARYTEKKILRGIKRDWGFEPRAARYPLPVTRYPLPVTRYPLPVTRYPLPIA